MEHLEKFCLITGTFLISFFSFNNVPHFKSTSAAFSFSSQTVLMEWMTTHEMNWWEIQPILALHTIITQEWLCSSFEFSKLSSWLISSVDIFCHNSFILVNLSSILFESKILIKNYLWRKKPLIYLYSILLLLDKIFKIGSGDRLEILASYSRI